MGVDTLIKELNFDYASTKETTSKLLFLIDEVSQYVGTNKDILLNFQTIIEDIGAEISQQVWVLCTAQQQLDEVSKGVNGVDDVEGSLAKSWDVLTLGFRWPAPMRQKSATSRP